MARLDYLNDPEHLKAFQAADVVDGRDENGQDWTVYPLQLHRQGSDGVLSRGHWPPFIVPIVRARGELLQLLEDCLEFKGNCDRDLLVAEQRRLRQAAEGSR